jgi:hypothetical protein
MVIDYENLFAPSCLKHFKIGGGGGPKATSEYKKKYRNSLKMPIKHKNPKFPTSCKLGTFEQK